MTQTTGPGDYGPFFGVDTYDADVNPYVLGSLGVDAKTGDVLYQLQGTGDLTDTGFLVTFQPMVPLSPGIGLCYRYLRVSRRRPVRSDWLRRRVVWSG